MTRGSFSRCACDWQQALSRAAALSSMHTPVLGTRALDILHVALALESNCKEFFTCDERQAKLATASRLRVVLVRTED